MSEGQPALDVLQGWMQNALVSPRQADCKETEKIVQASPRLSASERLAIYQRSYYLRLIKCMDEQFPALRHALGKELFADFARQYLRVLPSESYTLYDLGRRFPGFLEETRPDRENSENKREIWVNFMVDLAQCERDLFVMFEAPGHEGKPFADERVPDDRLRLQSCFALHQYRFPVSWYYYQVRDEKDPTLPPEEQSCVALVRKEYLTRTFPLSELHFSFLSEMADGKRVAEALEVVAEGSGRSMEELTIAWSHPDGIRNHWINAGFFIDAENAQNEGQLEHRHRERS